MSKIPVGATIAHAYSFTIKNFLNILGAMWLPVAAWIALFVAVIAAGMNMGADPLNPASMVPMIPIVIIAYVLGILCSLMPAIAMMEKALGLRDGPIFFYFSLGKPVWRLLGGILLFILVLIGTAITVAIVAGVIGGIAGIAVFSGGESRATGLGIAVLLIPILMIAIYCFFIYAMVRLTFLLVPVTVAENRGPGG